MAGVHALVGTPPVPPLARGVLGMPWALGGAGCVRGGGTLGGMQSVVRGWAPGLANATAAIQGGLCWHQPCGPHHGGLWGPPPKGVVLGHWVGALAQMGVQKPHATTMLLRVGATIAAALPGVWGAPPAKAHQQHGAGGKRVGLDAQLGGMLAGLANAGKALSTQRGRKLGRGPASGGWLRKGGAGPTAGAVYARGPPSNVAPVGGGAGAGASSAGGRGGGCPGGGSTGGAGVVANVGAKGRWGPASVDGVGLAGWA